MKQNKPGSESTKKDRNPASILTSGMGERITTLSKMVSGKKELAAIAGLSESQLHRIVSGKSQAKIENIAAMASGARVSLEWLATGNGTMRPEDCESEGRMTKESRRLQEKQRQEQQEKFKKGLQLMFEQSKFDPDYNPDGVWSALLIELLAMHGLQESGYQRIQETLTKLKQRDEDKHRDN